jgi:F-type H+-transporting ATPase subunit alpha
MQINTAEITAILKKEIANFDTQTQVSEVGQVISIGDGVASR